MYDSAAALAALSEIESRLEQSPHAALGLEYGASIDEAFGAYHHLASMIRMERYVSGETIQRARVANEKLRAHLHVVTDRQRTRPLSFRSVTHPGEE
jgi:hypothetical protein